MFVSGMFLGKKVEIKISMVDTELFKIVAFPPPKLKTNKPITFTICSFSTTKHFQSDLKNIYFKWCHQGFF